MDYNRIFETFGCSVGVQEKQSDIIQVCQFCRVHWDLDSCEKGMRQGKGNYFVRIDSNTKYMVLNSFCARTK